MNRWIVAALGVVVVTIAAVAYSYLAPKRYEAVARVVVHPVAADDRTFVGIDVLRDSPDLDAVLGTAASYFETRAVTDAVASHLGLARGKVADSVDARPLAGANVIQIVGSDDDATVAAQIANGVVQEGIAQRTARFQAQLAAVLAKLGGASSPEAHQRIVDLKTMQGRPDPTLEQLGAAATPASASSPKPGTVIPIALLVALGLGALFLLLPSFKALRPMPSSAAADRDEALARRERALARRERELEQAVDEARAATADKDRMDERVASVTRREQEMANEVAALTQRERELDERRRAGNERDAALDERETKLSEREAARPRRRPTTPSEAGAWRIEDLEHLVAEHGGEHPDRVEEWRYYVHFLREHADADGHLPATFDYLVEDAFSELLR